MKSKQEVIQEAWLEFMTENDYKNLKIDDNGFCNYQCRRYINSSRWDELYSRVKSGGKTGRDIIYRPKSLSGIEANNGWIRIESEEDLPKEDIDCFYIPKRSGKIVVGCFRLSSYKGWKNMFTVDHNIAVGLGQVTHYQPIIKPEAPIY